MNNKEIINKIFKYVFDSECLLSIDQVLEKYAFDVKIPNKVYDSTTGEVTWADSINNDKFITNKNMELRDSSTGWMLPKRKISGLSDILDIWDSINYTTTERVYDSINVSCSDTIYNSQNIFRSSDCTRSRNLIFCDSCVDSEFLLASQRSFSCFYSIRCDDSKNCSNSYNVICSNKISNSFFIQDSSNLDECMFCSHISSKKYCIANMQFEKNEYFEIKKLIVQWILNS